MVRLIVVSGVYLYKYNIAGIVSALISLPTASSIEVFHWVTSY